MDWPNMKDKDRATYWKSQHKIAYPDSHTSKGRVLSTKELFEILSNR